MDAAVSNAPQLGSDTSYGMMVYIVSYMLVALSCIWFGAESSQWKC